MIRHTGNDEVQKLLLVCHTKTIIFPLKDALKIEFFKLQKEKKGTLHILHREVEHPLVVTSRLADLDVQKDPPQIAQV